METSRNIMKEQPKDKFPITVKKGHAAVKIYQMKNREAVNYCVSYIGPTGRQRHNFADLDLPSARPTTSRNTLHPATWKR